MGSLGDFRNGVNFSRSKKGSGLRLINVKDLYRDGPYLEFDSLDLVNIGEIRGIENYYVGKGDLFFARSSVKRSGIGQVCMSDRNDNETVHCGFVIRFRPYPKSVDSLFLTYVLRSQNYRKQLISVSGGSAIINITQSSLAELELTLPSISEQKVLSSVLSTYDDLIENNRRRIQLLEEMARALYREWFVHFRFPGHEDVEMVDSELGAIPEGWRVTPFTEMADILSGGTPRTHKPEYWNGTIPFFTPRDIKDGFYILDTERHITRLGLDNCKSEDFPKDTVFITARGTVGRVVMPAVPMAMSQTSYALRGRHNIEQAFVFYKTLECVDQLKKMTHGAVFDTIITETFRMLKISLPPKEIITSFCTAVSLLLDLILIQIKQNSVLQSTRDILLPRLVSGKLDVSDFEIDIPTDTHKPSIESGQSTLDKWLDEDNEEE